MIAVFEKLFPNHKFNWNKRGTNATGCCPFHNDRSPSFSIYTDQHGKQRWHCMSEGIGGREVDAVMRAVEGSTRASANRWLIQNGFLQETEYDVAVARKNELIDRFYQWSNNMLLTDPLASRIRTWLEGRGVTKIVMEIAPIGFYPGVDAVTEWCIKNSIPEDLVKELLPPGKDGNRLVAGGIIFFYKAAFDLWSRLKVRNPFLENAESGKKVLYLGTKTSKSEGFFAGSVRCAGVDKAIIVEGEVDVLVGESLCTRETIDAVEPIYSFGSGNKLDDGVKLLTDAGVSNMYVFPDNDEQGLDYAFKLANTHPYTYILFPQDYSPREDPADWFARNTFDEFLVMYRARIKAFEWVGQKLAEIYKSGAIEDQAKAKDQVLEYARKLSPSDRELFLKSYAPLTGVSYESLWEEAQTIDQVRYRKYLDQEKFGIHMMVPKTKNVEYEQISNLVIEFVRDVVMDDGEDEAPFTELEEGDTTPDETDPTEGLTQIAAFEDCTRSANHKERMLVLRLAMPTREKLIKISSSDFLDDKIFNNILMRELGSALWIKPRHLPYLREAASVLPSSMTRKEEIVFTHTGWRNGKFLMPNGYVDIKGFHELGDIKVELPPNPPMFSYLRLAEPAADLEPIKNCLRNHILKVFPYSVTLPMLAHIFLAPLVRLDRRFTPYALWVQGTTGSFKTTYSCLLASFFGDFTNQGSFETWRSTSNSLEKNGYFMKDCIYIIDDYKAGDVDTKYVTTLMQNYGSGAGRSRLRADQTQQKTWSIRGLILATGEDIPTGESSVIARTIIVPIHSPGNTEHLTEGQKMARHLPGLFTKYLQYVIEHRRQIVGDDTFEYIMERSRTFATQHQRVKVNLALNAFGWRLASEFLGLTDLDDEYNAAMDGIARYMDLSTRSEQASNMFLDLTRELISSGDFYLEGVKGAESTEMSSNLSKRIGFISPDAVYLEGTVAMAAVNALRIKLYGSGIKYSQSAIYDQLQADGKLILQNGKKTGTLKCKGTSHRVLKLRLGTIEGGEVDEDFSLASDGGESGPQFKNGSEVIYTK